MRGFFLSLTPVMLLQGDGGRGGASGVDKDKDKTSADAITGGRGRSPGAHGENLGGPGAGNERSGTGTTGAGSDRGFGRDGGSGGAKGFSTEEGYFPAGNLPDGVGNPNREGSNNLDTPKNNAAPSIPGNQGEDRKRAAVASNRAEEEREKRRRASLTLGIPGNLGRKNVLF